MLRATTRSALVQVALTARDLAIFETLTQVRFLTTAAIEWLHFPDRRAAWEEDMQARLRGEERIVYKPGRAVHRRLQLLVAAGYLSRMSRPTAIRKHVWGGREPDLLSLTEDGALALAATVDDAHLALESYRVRGRSTAVTQHTAEIGDVYAALRVKIATMPGMAMEDWRGDHLTARSYDHLTVVRQRAGGIERVSLPVVPDGTFVLVHPHGRLRVFIEVDRGTRRIETWREKIEAYHAYTGSIELRTRYQTDTFVLLTIVPTLTQQQRLMNATAAVIGSASSRYLFTVREAVHPLRIGSEWQKITAVNRAVVAAGFQRQATEKLIATTTGHVFLQ